MAIPRNLANLANQLNTDGEAPKIEVGDSSVAITDTGSNGTITFTTDGSERGRFNSSGYLLVGTNTSNANYGIPLLQLDNSSGPEFSLRRAATADGSTVGFMTGYSTHGLIGLMSFITDGAQTASSTPGALRFMTQASGATGSPTERARIPAAGGFQCVNSISVGNATPTTSGAGITFPATQSASSNANTLDDYEEGNFTPTLAEGSSSTTYTTQGGFYIKIGRMVYINLQLDCATTSASGSIIGIGGLPFTCGNTNNTGWCAISSGFNSSFNTNAGDSYVVYPTTAIVRVYANDGNYRSPSAGGINLNGSICLSGCYYID